MEEEEHRGYRQPLRTWFEKNYRLNYSGLPLIEQVYQWWPTHEEEEDDVFETYFSNSLSKYSSG